MSQQITSLVVSGNGTNCERETAYACRLAGADQVEVATLWELISGEAALEHYDLLCLPGGFTDGDDLGAALATANRLRYAKIGPTGQPVIESLQAFVDGGGLIIGICNGFQLLVKLGLLPFADLRPRSTLTFNQRGRFDDRWVTLAADPASPCIFTRGLERLELPVRYGEGRLVLDGDRTGEELRAQHLVPLRYIDPATGRPSGQYPHDPGGSWDQAAGLCDPSGRIFGLMPHPEAFLHHTNHPRWTRESLPQEGIGVAIFRNAVDHLRVWKGTPRLSRPPKA